MKRKKFVSIFIIAVFLLTIVAYSILCVYMVELLHALECTAALLYTLQCIHIIIFCIFGTFLKVFSDLRPKYHFPISLVLDCILGIIIGISLSFAPVYLYYPWILLIFILATIAAIFNIFYDYNIIPN